MNNICTISLTKEHIHKMQKLNQMNNDIILIMTLQYQYITFLLA